MPGHVPHGQAADEASTRAGAPGDPLHAAPPQLGVRSQRPRGRRRAGTYWEMLEAMFVSQPLWADHHQPRPELIPEIAQQVGLDMAAFNRPCPGRRTSRRSRSTRPTARPWASTAPPPSSSTARCSRSWVTISCAPWWRRKWPRRAAERGASAGTRQTLTLTLSQLRWARGKQSARSADSRPESPLSVRPRPRSGRG